MKVIGSVPLQGNYKFVAKTFRLYIKNTLFRKIVLNFVPNGVKQVGLTQSGGTVNKQRVIVGLAADAARILCHRHGCTVSKFVGIALNKGVKGMNIPRLLRGQQIGILGLYFFFRRIVPGCDLYRNMKADHFFKCRFQRFFILLADNIVFHLVITFHHSTLAVQVL